MKGLSKETLAALNDYMALAAFGAYKHSPQSKAADGGAMPDWYGLDGIRRRYWRIAVAAMYAIVAMNGAKIATDRHRALMNVAKAGYEAYRAAADGKDRKGGAMDPWPAADSKEPPPPWAQGWLAVSAYLHEVCDG